MLSHPQAEFVERTHCINCRSQNLEELSRGRFTEQPLAGFIESDPSGEDILPYFQKAEWSLVRCAACGQVFHRRILTDAWNEKRFSDWMTAEAITEFENRNSIPKVREFGAARQYVEHILRLERLTRPIRTDNEPVRLLDFGCGWGKFLECCKTFGFDAVGIDRSNPRVSGANIEIFPSIEAIGEAPPFHAITLFEVLEHLDQPSVILGRLSGMIIKGGILVLETPDCKGVTDIKSHFDYLKIHPLEHINDFTHETLRSIAERNGFSMISKGPAHVTTSLFRATYREAKRALRQSNKSTQLYFSKDRIIPQEVDQLFASAAFAECKRGVSEITGIDCSDVEFSFLEKNTRVADAASIFSITPKRGQHPAFVIKCSNNHFPMIALDEARRAEAVYAVTSGQVRKAMVKPIFSGMHGAQSFAVYPWVVSLSPNRATARLKRPFVRKQIYNWLLELTQQTAHRLSPDQQRSIFNDPLVTLAQTDGPVSLVGGATRTLRALQTGAWQPQAVAMHGDLWKGNIFKTPKEDRLIIIDWGASLVSGYALFDLIRLAISLAAPPEELAKQIELHLKLLGPTDPNYYLLSALAYLRANLGQFSLLSFEAMALECIRALDECRQFL